MSGRNARDSMRHDDTIRTAVLLAAKDSPDARAAAFRQLVDLSLQGRECDDPALRWRALRALAKLSKTVPEPLANAMIDKAARQGARSLHLRLFRGSVSHHFDRMLQVARLDEAEWWRLARRSPQHIRAGMLARKDLPGPVRELLTGSAAGRLFVPEPGLAAQPSSIADKSRFAPPPLDTMSVGAASPSIDHGRSQIRELIDRIAAFRSRMHGAPAATGEAEAAKPAPPVAARWTWRCDETGVFVASPDMPRHLVGCWLTEFESADAPGQLVRALERRVPFRDLAVQAGPNFAVSGKWRISGLPQFDRKSGRFTGYWGSAIALDQTAVAEPSAETSQAAGLFGTGASSEALTTMAHEVRTPLNAIIGFAQLIEGEILGEASDDYKRQAGTILKHAEKLLGAFDDLSDAARIEQGRYRVGTGKFDAAAIAADVIGRYQNIAADRGVGVVPMIAADLPEVSNDSSVFERALSRLITSALAAAVEGEAIFVVVQRSTGDTLRVAVSRPRATINKSADQLFDPLGLVVGDDTAPILGIGFGLKLVGSLAATIGGSFELRPHLFELTLPIMHENRESEAS